MNRIAAQRLSSTSRFSEPGLSVEVGNHCVPWAGSLSLIR